MRDLYGVLILANVSLIHASGYGQGRITNREITPEFTVASTCSSIRCYKPANYGVSFRRAWGGVWPRRHVFIPKIGRTPFSMLAVTVRAVPEWE